MKVLVVYDSVYGNTEKIAAAISGAISGEVKKVRISEVNLADEKGIGLLFVGGPTQGGRTTQAMREFLDKIPPSSLKGVKAAVFDTRLSNKLVGIFGYAAGRIANSLKGKGADLIVQPEGFFVKGGQGPLKEGELERATAWAKAISAKNS
jgi:flavodoxin I